MSEHATNLEAKKRQSPPSLRDRKLGDEWQNWTGTTEESRQGKGLFCFLLVLSFACVVLALWVLFYLVAPRLAEFHPSLPEWTGKIGATLLTIFSLWSLLLVISLGLERNLLGPILPRRGIPQWWSRLASRLGRYMNYSADSVGNSYIKLHNSHVRLRNRNGITSRNDLLILLPRCLDRATREKIRELKEELGLNTHTVGGGEAARDLITKLRPKAIVAVACERDLITGIRDVDARVPVIGIPNERPEGPCKNTWIDVSLLENDIRYFLSGGR